MTEPLDLTALRALCDAATPGPWTSITDNGRKDGIAIIGAVADRGTGNALAVFASTNGHRRADAALAAAARTAVPALLDRVAELTAENLQLADALHRSLATSRRCSDARVALMADVGRLTAALAEIAESPADDSGVCVPVVVGKPTPWSTGGTSLTMQCPMCNAPVGEQCRGKSGPKALPHIERIREFTTAYYATAPASTVPDSTAGAA